MENPNIDMKQNLEETAPAEAPEAVEEKTAEDVEKEHTAGQADGRTQSRRNIIYLLAGGYLIYLGYNLCKNVIMGEEGATPVFFAAGAAFVVLGLVFCVMGGKDALKAEKEKKEAAEQRKKASSPKPEADKKPMSIADRAKLVRPSEEEGDEE